MTGSIRRPSLGWLALSAVAASPLLAACGAQSPATGEETSSALGSDQCSVAPENSSATASCPSGQTITQVAFASYGTPGGTCGDFTVDPSCNASGSLPAATAACVGKSACSIGANNGVFGDPCYGTTKKLALEVTCSGGGGATADAGSGGGGTNAGTNVCASAAEQGTATLSCPSGQTIGSIVFASYGTPSGSCDAFQTGACNATTSLSAVQSACEGKSTCTVPANNGVFGDPCVGTQKALFLEARCTGGTTTSPTPPPTSPPTPPTTPVGGTCSYDVSLAAAGAHNTSAFPTYDQAHFPANFGTSTWITQSGQTMTIDPTKMDLSQNPVTPGHVSATNVHTLIPSRPDLRWFAHLTPWFDQDNNGHIDIGLNVNTPAYVASMIADTKRRGFDGVIIDWYGKGHYTDTFVQLLKANLATRAAKDFTYMIMLDQGIAGLDESVLEQQVSYVESEYGTDPAYEKEGGKPILLFIGVDDKVGQAAMYTAKANTGNASEWATEGVDATKTWADQTYDWAHADGGGVSSTDRYNLSAIEGYYGAVSWVGTRKAFGAMMSGFNGMLTRSTSWSQGLYLPRDSGACQMAWAAKTNQVIPSQVTRMQWATWSDWEEGTSIEGGVENDANVTASVDGANVSWNVTTGTSDESTIDHYEIYAATAASPDAAVDLGSVPAGTHTYKLGSASCALAAGTAYKLTVDAIGKANIRDHLSAPVPFTAP